MKHLFAVAAVLLCLNVFSQDTIYITSTSYPDLTEHAYNPVDSLCDPVLLGTMPWAFLKSLDSEADVVYILFNIPGQGPHIIYLTYALPQLTRRVFIDATVQSGYLPGLPAIIIDGNQNVRHGISLYNVSNCTIKGLCIRNFQYTGIFCYHVNNSVFTENVIYNITRNLYDLLLGEGNIGFVGSSNNIIKGNILGTDYYGNVYSNRHAGINFQKIPSDRIATPPSSGNTTGSTVQGEGNIIANANKGIIVGAGCNGNRISGNKIYNNGVAIYLSPGSLFPFETGGNYNKSAPYIDSYNGITVTGTSAPNDIIEIFGSTGNENANEYLATVTADENGDWTANVGTMYSGVVATAMDIHYNTSSLTAFVQKEITFPEEPAIYSPNGIFDTVYDRFGNAYTLEQIRFTRSQTRTLTSQVCGAFEVFFETNCGMENDLDPTQNERRTVLCQVLNDISAFLNVSNNANKVNLWVRDFSQTGVPSSVGAVGSAFYLVPYSSPIIGGIADNQVWKTLISNIDAFTNSVSPLNYTVGSGFYHGMISLNFNNFLWNTNLSITTISNYDLYTIILHEIMHNLGFNTLINDIGDSQLGSNRNYKSRYDLFLKASNNANLLSSVLTASIMYNFQFNPTLNSTHLISTSCNTAVKYVSGNVNQVTYTPPSYNDAQSLSHFNEECSMPPYPLNSYFVMTHSASPGMIKRYLKPEEQFVLCDLGYNVQSVYGCVSNNTFYNYGSSCSSGMVVGINDGINASGGYSFVFNSSSIPLNIHPLANDVGPSGVTIQMEGFEQILGTGSVSSNLYSATILPSSPGLNVYRYVPYNPITGARGNITYVFAFRLENCAPNICDLVVNGDFEALPLCGETSTMPGTNNLGTNPLPCWYRLNNTADFYSTNCNDAAYIIPTNIYSPGTVVYNAPTTLNSCFMGLFSPAANNPEVVQTYLSSPLIPGENYILTFVAKCALPTNAYITIFFGSSNGFVSGLPINPLNQIVPYNATRINATEGWKRITIPFQFNSSNPHDVLIIGNNTAYSEGFISYFFIDDISIIPADLTPEFTLPTSICQYETIDDLSLYTSPPGGVFTGPNVSGNTFYANSAGVNTITYTITDPNGCTRSESVDITVTSVPYPAFTATGSCMSNPFEFTNNTQSTNTDITYTWSVDGVFLTSTNSTAPIYYTFTEPGYHQVSLLNTNNLNGCTSATNKQWVYVSPSQTSDASDVNYNCCLDEIQYDYDILTIEGPNPTIWDNAGVIRVKRAIIIRNGGLLVISNGTIVSFNSGAYIDVGYNGKLEIYGSTLGGIHPYIDCKNMWEGIRVAGLNGHTHYKPYDLQYIGKVIIKNSTIRDAHIAILVGRTQLPNNYTGNSWYSPYQRNGYISVENTTFSNNGKNVQFLKWVPASSGSAMRWYDFSTIKHCTFITDGALLDPGYNTVCPYYSSYPNQFNPYYASANTLQRSPVGIHLWGRTIKPSSNFDDNTFKNIQIGILSYDASYKVTNSDFDNVNRGIYIFNPNPSLYSLKHNILYNDFKTSSNNAIEISNGRFDYIKGNTFGKDNLTTSHFDNPRSILLNSTSDFKINDNSFYRVEIAIISNGQSLGANFIGYENGGNNFVQTGINIVGLGNNSFLQTKCNNTYNNVPADYNYGFNWYMYGGVANQGLPVIPGGTFNQNTKRPTGNKFIPTPINNIESGQSTMFTYYQHNAPPDRMVSQLFSPQITIATEPVAFDVVNPNNSCLSWPIPSTNPTLLIQEYTTEIAEIKQREDQYNILLAQLDRGETSYLLSKINSTSPGQLKNILLSHFPLSDTVIIAAVNRNNPLTPGVIKEILVANCPLSNNVWSQIQSKVNSLPPGISAQIKKAQGSNPSVTTLTSIQREIDEHTYNAKRCIQNIIIHYIERDSLPAAIDFLRTVPYTDARMTLISTLAEDSSTVSEASALLQQFIPSNEDESKWKEIEEIYIGLIEQNKSLYEIDSVSLSRIWQIASEDNHTLAVGNARSILHFLFGTEFPFEIEFENNGLRRANMTSESDVSSYNIYPIPSTGKLCITKEDGFSINETLAIYDVTGKMVYEQLLPENAFNFSFSVILPNGVYLCRVFNSKIQTFEKQIIIQK